MTIEEMTGPWYRQPWAWFVLTPLIVVVVACAFFVSLAFRHADDVVTDNYYKEGRMINQRLEQDQRALQMGLSGELAFDLEVGEALLSLSADPAAQHHMPGQLLVLLNHPTSARLDRQIVLNRVRPGHYRADLESRLQHKWYVLLLPTLEAEKHKQAAWRLTGEIDFQRQHTLAFNAP